MAFSRRNSFQSTHPRGVRPWIKISIKSFIRFQSTHPRGVRHCLECGFADEIEVSIHAPARGATREFYIDFTSPRVSIHAPARGATCAKKYGAIPKRFQSTHPRGVRLTIK